MGRQKSELRILIIEDEYMISMLLDQVLRDWGFRDVVIAHSLKEAFAAVNSRMPDFAFLDVMLHDRTTFDVADLLASSGVPFIFLTAVSDGAMPAKWRDKPRLEKPVHFAELNRLFSKILPI